MVDSTFKNANILIVDDMKVNIDILAGLLEIQGYTNIKSTTDPRLVVELFQSFSPDLILLDLMMPHLTGYEVMAQLKEFIAPNVYLPILVLTADLTPEARQRALADGAKDFLAKPFDLIEVGLRIDNLLFARYLYQQLQQQNLELEIKVKERTLELEKTNVELFAAKEKAELSDRLKTAFLNNISHEIRTPLNGILGMYQMLTDTEVSQGEKERYFNRLQASSDRLISTITNYLDSALLVSGNIEVSMSAFEPAVLLEEIYGSFLCASESKHLALTVQTTSPFACSRMESDQEIIRKALSHLVDNAIKFTHKGQVVIGAGEKEKGVEFFVQDTGVGIEDALQKTIFNYFAQENISNTRGHEGSGLGLSIAKKMVELIGGEIRLESVKGQGSTFYVFIPCKVIC